MLEPISGLPSRLSVVPPVAFPVKWSGKSDLQSKPHLAKKPLRFRDPGAGWA